MPPASRPSLGPLNCCWIEAHCVIPDRDDRGKPFRLYDEQLTFFDRHYELKPTARVGQLAPAFVYRRSLLVRPQKWGKGPLTAAQICDEGVGPVLFAGWAEGGEVYDCRDHGCGCGFVYEYEPGEPMGRPWATPLIQITAMSEEQTDNIYGALRPMIEYGPLAELIPRTGEEFIRLPGGGRIDTVTSSAQSRLGQRVTFVPQDECGLWTETNKMRKVADTQYRGLAGMGGRATLTTNGWDPAEASVAQLAYESPATDIYRDFVQAPANLSYGNKVERRKIHRIVYGDSLKSRGGHIDLDSIEAEAADLAHRDIGQAERFFGNRIVYGAGAWLEGDLWDARAEPRDVPAGTAVVGGFDGSDTDDWTAIRLQTEDGYQFTPRYGPDRRPCIWNPAEFGGQVPRLEVRAAWSEITTRFKVVRVYLDPPGWKSEIDELAEEHGEKVFVRWETYRQIQMHAAAVRLHTDVVKTGTTFTHDGDEIVKVHIRNTRKLARPGMRYVLGKSSQQQKIDATISSILADEAAGDVTAAGLWPQPADDLIYTASSTRYGGR
jgi:hypothetical protein